MVCTFTLPLLKQYRSQQFAFALTLLALFCFPLLVSPNSQISSSMLQQQSYRIQLTNQPISSSISGHESSYTQLWPIFFLPRVQPIEESILRLVFAQKEVSLSPVSHSTSSCVCFFQESAPVVSTTTIPCCCCCCCQIGAVRHGLRAIVVIDTQLCG